MSRILHRFVRDENGSAASEMALSLPMLIALILGTYELGTYFWAQHKVVKAVRDGARYAARQSFAEYAGCAPSSTVIDDTQNVTRTGQVNDGGTPRWGTWTDPDTTIFVTADCDTGGTYSDAGMYAGSAIGAPVVTVRAAVPFTPLFSSLGLADVTLTLNARSESAVYGL